MSHQQQIIFQVFRVSRKHSNQQHNCLSEHPQNCWNGQSDVLLLWLNLCAPCRPTRKDLQLGLIMLVTSVAPSYALDLSHKLDVFSKSSCVALVKVRIVWTAASGRGNYKRLEMVGGKLQCHYFVQLLAQFLCTSQSCTSRSAFCYLSFVSQLWF